MALPTYVASGAQVSGTSTSLAPEYPAGISGGDLLVLQAIAHSSTVISNAGHNALVAAGWTQVHNDLFDAIRQYVYTKESDGSESGTLTVSFDLSAFHVAVIHAFRGGITLEGAALQTVNNGTSITMPAVTTAGADRLAVCLLGLQNSTDAGSSTGESGGDWAQVFDGGRTQVQTADMASAGTITGGSTSWAAANTDGIARAFAIVADASAGNAGRMMLTGVG